MVQLPKTVDLTKLDDRWRTAIWLGKSDRSDEHIIGLENGAVLARSVRRKVEGKRWDKRALEMVTGTPWNPRPGEVVARPRYITRALVERYGPTEDCGACFRKSQQHTERCRARCELLFAGEEGPVEARPQEGQPAPPDPAAPNLISTSTAAQTGGVDTDVLESEDIEPAVSSRGYATAAPIRPLVTGGDENARKQTTGQRTVTGLLVAAHEMDADQSMTTRQCERLSPHLVKVGRQTEHDAMTRHQLFERVPIAMARGKKVRCQWVEEMKEGANGPVVRSRLVAIVGVRFDTFAGTAPPKCIKIII